MTPVATFDDTVSGATWIPGTQRMGSHHFERLKIRMINEWLIKNNHGILIEFTTFYHWIYQSVCMIRDIASVSSLLSFLGRYHNMVCLKMRLSIPPKLQF